jgi:hypothetical protein
VTLFIYLLFLKMIALKIKAIVKNTAPPKHGVKKGLVVTATQPKVQVREFNQSISSLVKLNQAKIVPPNRTINCARITFFIKFYYITKI